MKAFKQTHNKLRSDAAVESQKAFIPEDFLGAIDTVLVEHLANDSTPLVLHPGYSASAMRQV